MSVCFNSHVQSLIRYRYRNFTIIFRIVVGNENIIQVGHTLTHK